MARISDITIKEQLHYHFLAVRKTINFMNEFESFTSNNFKCILDYLDNLNVLVSDGPIVCFHNMDLEKLDVEVGFPIARSISGDNVIQARKIEACKVVTSLDLGAYEKQDPTLEEMFSWIQEHNYVPTGEIYYQYLNNTNRPENEYLTKMIIPVQ